MMLSFSMLFPALFIFPAFFIFSTGQRGKKIFPVNSPSKILGTGDLSKFSPRQFPVEKKKTLFYTFLFFDCFPSNVVLLIKNPFTPSHPNDTFSRKENKI